MEYEIENGNFRFHIEPKVPYIESTTVLSDVLLELITISNI